MDRRTAKEYLHIRDWLEIAQRIVGKGEAAYLEDPVLQEAGDSGTSRGVTSAHVVGDGCLRQRSECRLLGRCRSRGDRSSGHSSVPARPTWEQGGIGARTKCNESLG